MILQQDKYFKCIKKLKQEDRFACSNAVLSAGGFKEVNVNIFNRGD